MSTYTSSMFDQIKNALNKDQNQNAGKYREIIKLAPGNTYTVRLIPNCEDPSKTFFHYYTTGWESFSTGRYLSNISPNTWGEKDPILDARMALSKHGTDEEKEKSKKIIRTERWLANVFVVNDPTTPDNNGKIKLLRYGKQLHKIIMDAIEGDDSDEYGAKIFDLSEEGCNLKIKCERQGDYPTYVSSRFAAPSKLTGTDDPNSLYTEIHDLETIFPAKSYEELKEVLNEHFYCNKANNGDDDWTPETKPEPETKPGNPVSKQADEVVNDVDPLDDTKVKELLDGLAD